TLLRQAEAETSREKKSELYVQLAESIERRSEDVTGAIHAYEQALVYEPASRVVLDALERLYRRTEASARLADILSRHAELTTDEREIVRLRLEVGSLLEPSDPARAIAAYEQVLELEPSHLAALERIAELCEDRDLDRAADAYAKILALDPRNTAPYHLLERLY